MCVYHQPLNPSVTLGSSHLSRIISFVDCWQSGGGFRIDGMAMLTDTNVYENRAGVCSPPVEPSLSSHPAPRWNVTWAHGWQEGGGLYIAGTATLTDTNVYENRAEVCSPVEPCLSSHSAPHSNVTCAYGWQRGEGLSISGTATSTATLTNTNVYKNQADYVCSPVEPSLSTHPAPC